MAARGTGEAVGFGVAQANAYFNARRMGRRAPTKAKSKADAKTREAEADEEEGEADQKLVLPPPSALRAILRSVDERDVKRQRIKHQASMQATLHVLLWKHKDLMDCVMAVPDMAQPVAGELQSALLRLWLQACDAACALLSLVV